MRITDLAIQRLSLPDGATRQKTFYDDTLKGFGIRVSVGGAKTFVVMYSKRRKRMTLGRYPDISLAEARKKAKKLQGEVAGMSDVELTVHISPTFNEARIRFLEDAMARLKLSSYEQYSRPLTKHFAQEPDVPRHHAPVLGKLRRDLRLAALEAVGTPELREGSADADGGDESRRGAGAVQEGERGSADVAGCRHADSVDGQVRFC